MNIAILIKSTTFHKGYGGFETLNKLLSEALVKRGHKVVVYVPKKELSEDSIEENGVLYKFINCRFGKFKVLYEKAKDSWDNKSVEIFSTDHKNNKYDLVIGQSSWALPIIKKKNELGIKVISILHGSKIGEYQTQLKNVKSLKEFLYCIRDLPHVLRAFFITQRQFVHGSDKLVAVSNSVKKAIIDETYVAEEKIEVIHNGVDEKKFISNEVYKTESPEVNIIYIGRVIRAKGVFILIEALEKIKDLNWKLNLVGEGESLEDTKELVKKKGLENKVTFKGLLKYEKVVSELVGSDIFVLPSMRMEGFPMTIVEAMFAKLPVVASDIGGNSDAVISGETGFLVKPGDIEDLSEKLGVLIKDFDLRIKYGEKGSEKALKEFTIEAMIDKYEKLFKEVLK